VGEPLLEEPLAGAEPQSGEALFEASSAANDPYAAPLALYRRYRPDTFAAVIGQEHVTEPLQRALTNNRVNHAYLFSGPRGCGKTTSARILARCLNCAKGPRAEPCGECQSCRDLARGGSGSIDVIEIDAASHGGVDDARDLRERAFFAPVSSRYKIYVVDEAHMVTTAGFNALLKLVEEPPPHVKFIFATTEPDKVIGTIRSRTHHYPFRLVPPRVLGAYLVKLCAAEGIAVEPAVLPLVVRAGAGSVRDSLSVLDQLLGGADADGVTYAQAAALLGYTPDALLDEFVDALAAGDAAGVFGCVDKVIEVGQDPRRFAEDLLRRLRDLMVVAAVPDACTSGLVDVSADQAERLSTQAATLGPGELTRAGEVIAAGLTEMRGTTAPRLHLELICARILLPGADVDDRGVHARLDRLERRVGVTAEHPEALREPQPPAAAVPAGATSERRVPPATQAAPRTSAGPPEPAHAPRGRPATPSAGSERAEQAKATPPSKQAVASATPQLSVTEVRRLWPEVLEEVKSKRRFTWILLSQNAHVSDVRDGTLLLSMPNAGARDSFARAGNEDVLREAIVVALGVDLRVNTMVDPGVSAVPGIPSAAGAGRSGPVDRSTGGAAEASVREAVGGGGPTARAGEPAGGPAAAAPSAHSRGVAPVDSSAGASGSDDPDDMPRRDDANLDESDESHTELLARQLGAEVIAEEDHDT
jgi:DNA polymerase-3 subunit gamma/tau